jgi:hypothetical protein
MPLIKLLKNIMALRLPWYHNNLSIRESLIELHPENMYTEQELRETVTAGLFSVIQAGKKEKQLER